MSVERDSWTGSFETNHELNVQTRVQPPALVHEAWLKIANRPEALTLLLAKNEAARQPVLDLQKRREELPCNQGQGIDLDLQTIGSVRAPEPGKDEDGHKALYGWTD